MKKTDADFVGFARYKCIESASIPFQGRLLTIARSLFRNGSRSSRAEASGRDFHSALLGIAAGLLTPGVPGQNTLYVLRIVNKGESLVNIDAFSVL